MASHRRASAQAEWQRPPQRTPHSHIAYLPGGGFLMPSGRPTAHPGELESGRPRSVRPTPPPPRRGLSEAQAALSATGQTHVSLSRGSSLQPAVHQAAGHYWAVPHSPQQQQQQWLLPAQGQSQPALPFQCHEAWVQSAYCHPSYSQQQQLTMPQQMAEHQSALQQPGMASAQYAHAWPQPRQQPSVQHVTQQTLPQRVFSTQKSSLNANARPFVGSAKASVPTSVEADVCSEASGSGVSSSRTSPSTSSPLQGTATGRSDQRCVDRQLNASARAYIPQQSLKRNTQEDGQPSPQLHLHVAAQARPDSASAVESGLQPAADVERACHLLLPEPTASRDQPMPKSAGQHPLSQELLAQASEQPQEQLPELAELSGGTGPSSGTGSVSPSLLSSAAAKGVPAVAVEQVPFAIDDVAVPAWTSSPTSAAPEHGPYVCIQKGLVGSDDTSTMSSIIKAGILNEGSANESASSFTLGAHRGSILHSQQASGSLSSDASHQQTDVATPLTACGASAAVEAEPAVATAVDLAHSDCSTDAALDKTSAHSSVSPGTAAVHESQPLSHDSDSPTTATSSSGPQPFQPHVTTPRAASATQPSSDASTAGAAHASTGADKLAVGGAVSSGQATTAVAEPTDSSRLTSAAQISSSAASISTNAPKAGTRGLSSPSDSLLAMSDAQSGPSSPPGSFTGIGGAQPGLTSPLGPSMGLSGILLGPSSSRTAPTAADTQLVDSTSVLWQAEDKPDAAAEPAARAKSVTGHSSSSEMPSQARMLAEGSGSSTTAADGKGTDVVRAFTDMQLVSYGLSTADSHEAHTAGVPVASKAPAASKPALMQRLPATASSSPHHPLERSGCSSQDVGSHIDTPAHSSSSPSLNALAEGDEGSQPMVSSLPQGGGEETPAEGPSSFLLNTLLEGVKGAQLMPSSLPQGGEAQTPAVGSRATSAAAEQISAFAWQAAQLQSVTHATRADPAAPVSVAHGEPTVHRSWSSEATEVQAVGCTQQQASCSEQHQDSSSVPHEGDVKSRANAQQPVEQQHISSSAVFEEEAQPATETAAPVQPHQSLQQSAAEEEEQVLDPVTAREQQASVITCKDGDDGAAAQYPISEQEQQQLPGRSTGHDAHHHASTDVADCKVASDSGRQEEEPIALLTQAKVEGQSSNSPDPVREDEEQDPFQLATEEEEQGLLQSAAQEDKQQTPPSSPIRQEDKQGFSESASEAAEEEQQPTNPSDGAEQSADTSGPLLLLSSSPASEEEAAHWLQTNSAHDARLQASDTSLGADSSSQRKAKPGFLAKALFCSVAWPVLVPVVAFSSCIQLYDACSMCEDLKSGKVS
ncbi:TPA: hypothetical protein ACH3X2_013664 [Trebouxia sp. C0005]